MQGSVRFLTYVRTKRASPLSFSFLSFPPERLPNTVRGDAVRLQKWKPLLNNTALDPLVPLKYFNPVIYLKINCWLTSEVLKFIFLNKHFMWHRLINVIMIPLALEGLQKLVKYEDTMLLSYQSLFTCSQKYSVKI